MSARSAMWEADLDMMRHNPVHAAEREEHRAAVAAQRRSGEFSGCRHSRVGAGAVCPDCGHDLRREL